MRHGASSSCSRAAKTHLLWQQAAANLLNRKQQQQQQAGGDQEEGSAIGQRDRGGEGGQPMQGKPHYQNEFMHISKRANKQQRRGKKGVRQGNWRQ